ncbi:MAG: bifunctional demethylmenaquinone methyltransferase/2-methoxy-6-polyprenyl-1,4-benzoquinol methylase UbiE [Peptococcaceae bacterium]
MVNQFSDKDKYVKNLFNSIAKNYDVMNLIMTWGMLPRWQKFMLKKTGLKTGGSALDICCGTGELTLKLRDTVGPYGKVYGLDFSEKMLEIANKKAGAGGLQNVTFVQGDALELPFADDTFNAATNGFALRNVINISRAIEEMARVVKPGGKVVCLEVSRPLNPFLRMGFNLYFFNLVPLIGRIVDKGRAIDDKYPAYTWLPESLKKFPDQEKLKAIFWAAGLEQVAYFGLGGGAVTVHVGTKPGEE